MNKFMSGTLATVIMLGAFALPASAATTKTATAVDGKCMETAVDKRDTAIMNAIDTFHTAVKTALTTRKDALSAAWGNTDTTARKEALKTAWTNWKNEAKAARQSLNTARKSAWSTFQTDRKACKVTSSSDPTNSSVDSGL